MNRSITSVALAAGLVLVATGCGGGRDTATVTGRVTYKGQPLTAGSVAIHVAGRRPATGPINPDGTYRVEQAPVGEAKVAVQTPRPAPATKAAPGPVPGGAAPVRVVPIPDRFADADRTTLSAVVRSGGQQHDIDIRD